jgi:AraC-like DNA-binding protein
MTMGYFRLILRCFGDTADRRAALLEGTSVGERELVDPAADISLFQQVRQVENASRLFGPGWALSQPELWNPPAHGAISSAVLASADLGEGLATLSRYAHVRAPFFRMHMKTRGNGVRLEYELTVPLGEAQWLPMIEIALVSARSILASALGRAPTEAAFEFACAEPRHAARLGAALGERVSFSHRLNAMVFPKEWLDVPSAFADAALRNSAVAELEAILSRLEDPHDLRARVQRLLRTMPEGRLRAGDVARALGVSRRTLARRLESAGTPFRDLLDREMKSRAKELLALKMSRTDMAERLGYRDPTSFSRACRRWFPSNRR